jgi:hypothetical protein
MFDLATILTLIAPAFIALLACGLFLRAMGRAEAGRRADRPAPQPTQIVLDPGPTALAADHTRERSVA